jgi:filamin
VPVEPLESMLRPFNLVIPFTVQKGELTGTAWDPQAEGLRGQKSSCRPSLFS